VRQGVSVSGAVAEQRAFLLQRKSHDVVTISGVKPNLITRAETVRAGIRIGSHAEEDETVLRWEKALEIFLVLDTDRTLRIHAQFECYDGAILSQGAL
jgi:hypothetical protein